MKQRSIFLAMAFAIAGCTSGTGVFPAGNEFAASEGSSAGTGPQQCVQQTFYHDGDTDKYGDPNVSLSACKDAPPVGYVANADDCNDNAPSVHPGASEQCDKVDNDCNKLVDDTTKSWFYDDDGDGYGNPASELPGACNGLAKKYVANGDDCNDNNASVYPGAKEICDYVDSNCDGNTDKDIQNTLYMDLDLDGRGNGAKPIKACKPYGGVVISNDDCNDDPSKDGAKMFPGNPEVCDNLDNDCNKLVDDGDNVKKTYFMDDDGDGYGAPDKKVFACDVPVGATTTNTDCNDNPNSTPVNGKKIHPGATEFCNEVDDNCANGTDEDVKIAWRHDSDGDGFANPNSKITLACLAPPGMALGLGELADCNDADATVYPGAPEICDGKDNACAGLPMPPKEPDALCGDKSQFTNDFCLGAQGCVHEKQKFLMSCSNPEKFKASDGYTCGLVYYFGDALVDKTIVPIFEKEAASPLMEDVCIELWNGKTLHVSAFVQLDFDPKFIWIESAFVKLIDSFTNKEIPKTTPGNVVLGETIEFDLTAADIPACQ